MPKYLFASFVVLAVFLACSCSGGQGEPVGTPAGPGEGAGQGHRNTFCMGMWDVAMDPATGSLEAIPVRNAGGVLNVLSFLEPPALEHLTIDFGTLEFDETEGWLSVQVLLTNPMADSKLTGFDVRGTVFGAELVNPDGNTSWMNPNRFAGLPLGYQEGLLGTPGVRASDGDYKYFANGIAPELDLNGYFSYDENLANRGAFSPGRTIRRDYVLHWDSPGDFGKFQYAAVACWAKPTGLPPYGVSDFPPEANAPEPIAIWSGVYYNTAYYSPTLAGGDFSFALTVFDWQGPENHSVRISSADGLFTEAGPSQILVHDDCPMAATYLFEDILASPGRIGWHNIDVSLEADETYGGAYLSGLMDPDHPLYEDPIQVTYQERMFVHSPEPQVEPFQVGYLTFDYYEGPGGAAALGLHIISPADPVDYVVLETSTVSGEPVFIWNPPHHEDETMWYDIVENRSMYEPGTYDIPYTVYLMSGGLLTGFMPVEIVPQAAADPDYEERVTSCGKDIGKVTVDDEPTAKTKDYEPDGHTDYVRVHLKKKFTREDNCGDYNCDEYRWVQVILRQEFRGYPKAKVSSPYVEPPAHYELDYGNGKKVEQDGKPYYYNDNEAGDKSTFSDNAGGGVPDPSGPADKLLGERRFELCLVCVNYGTPGDSSTWNQAKDKILHCQVWGWGVYADGSVRPFHSTGTSGGSDQFKKALNKWKDDAGNPYQYE